MSNSRFPYRLQTSLKMCFLLLFLLYFNSVIAQNSNLLYTSEYFLPSFSQKLMIPINNSILLRSNNGLTQQLKITAKIQIRQSDGTFVDSPFKTGNIMVKYWKNQANTAAVSVLDYSYDFISFTKKVNYATDPMDRGVFDIEALYNYENEHNFLHTFGNEISDTLFVIGVYRYPDSNLTDLLLMSSLSDQIKISISVSRAPPSELRCSFCSVKTFCPANQCECYQETYSDCRVKKKTIAAKGDNTQKVQDAIILKAGTMSFLLVQPQNMTKQWYVAQIQFTFENNATTAIKPNRIYFLTRIQNKSDSSFTIPNIFNHDVIDSPSFNGKITTFAGLENSFSSEQNMNYRQIIADSNSLYLQQKVVLNKKEILTMAIYFLPDSQDPTLEDELNVAMEMEFGLTVSNTTQSSINLALVIGMVALGFFLLILLICMVHFFVSKRFSIFSVFSNSQSSNRTSIYTGRPRSRKIANISQQASTLPQISFDFVRQLVFKPFKFIYSPELHKKSNKKTNSQKLASHDEICSICLQEFTNQSRVKYTYCGHILDSNCLQSWFKKEWSCPMCRQRLEPEDISEYEERIMADIWDNTQYQSILEEEVEAIKKLYKQWQKPKIILQNTKYTEQNLAQNNGDYLTANKQTGNIIPNISTMAELEKTIQVIKGKESSKDNKQEGEYGINILSFSWINEIFANNKDKSMKKLIRIYRFYRCIYLYHQINKKFEKDSNLLQPSLYFDQKQSYNKEAEFKGQELKQKQQQNVGPRIGDESKHAELYITSRKYIIREQQQARYNFYEQNELETDFGTEQKLKSTKSLQKIKNKKSKGNQFHLDFLFEEPQQPVQSEQKPIQAIEEVLEPPLIRQNTDATLNLDAIKVRFHKKTKCLSMMEQMDGLERYIGGPEKKLDELNEQLRFKENQSVIFYEQDHEDERYIQVQSPVVLEDLQGIKKIPQQSSSGHKVPSLIPSRITIPSQRIIQSVSKKSENKKGSRRS